MAKAAATPALREPVTDGQPWSAVGDQEVAAGRLNGVASWDNDDISALPSEQGEPPAVGNPDAPELPTTNAATLEGDKAADHVKGDAPAEAEAHTGSRHSGEVQGGLPS